MNEKEHKIITLTEFLEFNQKTGYKLGSKFIPLSNPNPTGPVDCSGFSRWMMWHVGNMVNNLVYKSLPDGSVNQHVWAGSHLEKLNGSIEYPCIGFLPPDPIGHVFFLLSDLHTCESFGGHGPGRRNVADLHWIHLCEFYRI